LIFEFRGEFTEEIMNNLCKSVGASDDSAQMGNKHEEILAFRYYFYGETSDCIVEMKCRGLLIVIIWIFFVGVLISIIIRDDAFMIPGWNYIYMIMNGFADSLFNCFVL
jgi:hypothetical protein